MRQQKYKVYVPCGEHGHQWDSIAQCPHCYRRDQAAIARLAAAESERDALKATVALREELVRVCGEKIELQSAEIERLSRELEASRAFIRDWTLPRLESPGQFKMNIAAAVPVLVGERHLATVAAAHAAARGGLGGDGETNNG